MSRSGMNVPGHVDGVTLSGRVEAFVPFEGGDRTTYQALCPGCGWVGRSFEFLSLAYLESVVHECREEAPEDEREMGRDGDYALVRLVRDLHRKNGE